MFIFYLFCSVVDIIPTHLDLCFLLIVFTFVMNNVLTRNIRYRAYLPTLAATQSRYPAEVTAALERAGFNVLHSGPSPAPAWPLCDQKTELFLFMRSIIIFLTRVGISPQVGRDLGQQLVVRWPGLDQGRAHEDWGLELEDYCSSA